jgi:hypothetical protein
VLTVFGTQKFKSMASTSAWLLVKDLVMQKSLKKAKGQVGIVREKQYQIPTTDILLSPEKHKSIHKSSTLC